MGFGSVRPRGAAMLKSDRAIGMVSRRARRSTVLIVDAHAHRWFHGAMRAMTPRALQARMTEGRQTPSAREADCSTPTTRAGRLNAFNNVKPTDCRTRCGGEGGALLPDASREGADKFAANLRCAIRSSQLVVVQQSATI